MLLSIRKLHQVLSDTLQKIKNSAGADPFISQRDLSQLLEQVEENEQVFINQLFNLAKSLEETPSGRVTIADLEKLSGIIEHEILPEFTLLPGPITGGTALRLSAMNPHYRNVAAAWKLFALQQETVSLPDFVNHLRELMDGLVFNQFTPEGVPVEVFTVPFNQLTLDVDIFLQALESSGEQQWQEIAPIREWLIPDVDADTFLVNFPGYQQGANKDQANAIVEAMTNELLALNFFRFDFSHEERTQYFVPGIHQEGALVFLTHNIYWT